jgi:hypothetical protein
MGRELHDLHSKCIAKRMLHDARCRVSLIGLRAVCVTVQWRQARGTDKQVSATSIRLPASSQESPRDLLLESSAQKGAGVSRACIAIAASCGPRGRNTFARPPSLLTSTEAHCLWTATNLLLGDGFVS